ncbi:MAG: hypothetical protein OJF50_002588 [Nitrospira sp.]|nr:hypothetical protein [Nitrospira sp.]
MEVGYDLVPLSVSTMRVHRRRLMRPFRHIDRGVAASESDQLVNFTAGH